MRPSWARILRATTGQASFWMAGSNGLCGVGWSRSVQAAVPQNVFNDPRDDAAYVLATGVEKKSLRPVAVSPHKRARSLNEGVYLVPKPICRALSDAHSRAVSERNLRRIIKRLGETEAGSAGTQPGEG